MVFQDYALYPHLTAEENILLPFQVKRNEAASRRALADDLGRTFQVRHLWNRVPQQLSGGERQRIAILKSLVSGMPLWLMDEPLSHLDSRIRYSARAAIKHCQLRTHSTLIIVTHDPSDAMALGDWLIFLDEGKLVQAGRAEHVFRNPSTLGAARALRVPPPNEFVACVVCEDGSLWAQTGTQPNSTVRFPLARDATVQTGQRLVLLVDVHDTRVVSGPSSNSGCQLEARPEFCEPGLAYDIWECATSLGMVRCSAPATSVMPRDETVQLRLPYDVLRVFDASTEQSLGNIVVSLSGNVRA